MENIVITSNALSKRGKDIQKILRHISADSTNGPAYSHLRRPTQHIIGCHSSQSHTSENYRDWRFKTMVPTIYAMYFELWKPSQIYKYELWFLDRAYLNLYELPDIRFLDSLKEFICLHCDPNESEDDDHYLYKRIPHIHIKAAQEPIPHAHFSLNLDYSEKVLNSIDTLFSSLETAIMLLRDEILERMK